MDTDLTTTLIFAIGEDLNDSAREVLMSRLTYSLGDIQACSLDAEEAAIEIVMPVSERDRVEQLVGEVFSQVRGGRFLPKRMLHDNRDDDPSDHSHATVLLHAADHQKVQTALERKLRSICASYATDQDAYPSMIETRTMDRCNYLRTFPQNAYVVSQFPHDYSAVRDIKTIDDYHRLMEPSGKMLSPATCFHFYDRMADSVIDRNHAVLAKSHCFRHEAEWRLAPHRLREFDMLELILLGDASFVEDTRSRLIDQIWSLFRELGLKGFIETANDPFYFPDDKAKGQYQLLASTKYELVARSEKHGLQCAVASFNNVGNSLSKNFNIRDGSGENPHSGCIAFGLDRLVVALGWQHGPHLQLWPEAIVEVLSLGADND